MKNFEKIEQKVDREINIDKIYFKISEEIKKRDIDIKEFDDCYSEDAIQLDVKRVEKTKEKIQKGEREDSKEIRKLAEIFEMVFKEGVNKNEWLGSDTKIINTSEFDDIFNGIDSVAEFYKKDSFLSHLALAIDVTTSSNIDKKLFRIKDEIEKGKLANVKYFKSEELDAKELKNVPRIVISVNASTAKELANLWDKGDKKGLSDHWVQFQALEEIMKQLSVFKKYAEKENQDYLVVKYQEVEEIIQNIYKEKKGFIKDTGRRDLANDKLNQKLDRFEEIQTPKTTRELKPEGFRTEHKKKNIKKKVFIRN